MISRRQFLRSAAIGLALGTSMYTWRVEPHRLEMVERPLPVAFLPDRLKGARLMQLSDLHIGPRVDDSYLIHAFEIAKQIRPELVVYTGDLISYEQNVFAHADRLFAELPLGSRGTFGVLGNHDYGPSWQHSEVADKITQLAREQGVIILRNEVALVDGLQIAGLDDMWGTRFEPIRALTALDPKQASLVLSHNPDSADQPFWGGYSGWILAGHTHGGQCKPPFLPPPLLPVRNRRYTSGEFALSGNRRMYINRGVGYMIRVRFNVRPEVTVFHLEQA